MKMDIFTLSLYGMKMDMKNKLMCLREKKRAKISSSKFPAIEKNRIEKHRSFKYLIFNYLIPFIYSYYLIPFS